MSCTVHQTPAVEEGQSAFSLETQYPQYSRVPMSRHDAVRCFQTQYESTSAPA